MPFNGAGQFVPVAAPQFPAVSGSLIKSGDYNAVINDLMNNGLSLCVTRNGQSPPTANLPMGGFKFTNMADGAAATDSATTNQVTSLSTSLQAMYAATGGAALIGTNDGWANAAASLNARPIQAASKAAANALTTAQVGAGGVFITSADGGLFALVTSATAEDGGSYCGTNVHLSDSGTSGKILVRRLTSVQKIRGEWFGLVGDGTARNTEFQNAVTASAGRGLELPYSTAAAPILVTATINLPSAGITFFGQNGAGSFVQYSPAANGYLFSSVGNFNFFLNCYDMRFNGNFAGAPSVKQGFWLADKSGSLAGNAFNFERCVFSGFNHDYVIDGTQFIYCNWLNCKAIGPYSSTDTPATTTTRTSTFLRADGPWNSANEFYGGQIIQWKYGIQAACAFNWNITGVDFTNCFVGAVWYGLQSSSYSSSKNRMVGCYAERMAYSLGGFCTSYLVEENPTFATTTGGDVTVIGPLTSGTKDVGGTSVANGPDLTTQPGVLFKLESNGKLAYDSNFFTGQFDTLVGRSQDYAFNNLKARVFANLTDGYNSTVAQTPPAQFSLRLDVNNNGFIKAYRNFVKASASGAGFDAGMIWEGYVGWDFNSPQTDTYGNGNRLTTATVTAGGTGYTTATVTVGPVWAASTAYTAGNQVVSNNRLYTATSSGTSGTKAPNWGIGSTASDGGVTWQCVGTPGLYSATVSGGAVTAVVVGNVSGYGWSTTPTLTITGDGTGATATAATTPVRVTQARLTKNQFYTAATGAYNTSGADYAEFFEWADGNPNKEDRTGKTVTLVGDKIQLAQSGDSILGVVSATAGVIGNADNADSDWHQKYQYDDLGRMLKDDTNAPLLNPTYDPTKTFVPRSERPEWAIIGLVGRVRILANQPVDPSWKLMRAISANVSEYFIR